jgi:hypothetical protein
MATTLAHANMANDEAKASSQTEQLDKISLPVDILPEEKRVNEQVNVVFKLVKKRRGRTYLDNCCDPVPNPENNNIPERIWLLSGANDIWESKVENILKDKNRYERARRGMDIVFHDGVCRVRTTDLLRLKFLRNHIKNVGKKRAGAGNYDFYEYSPADEQKERMAKQLLKIELVRTIEKMPFEKVRKLASFFAIPFVDEIGLPKTEDGIKTELMLKADSDPATVQKHIDSKEVEVAYLVKKAILDGKVDLGGESGNITWANGKGFIGKLPSTRKGYEYLTELALTNSEEGRNFKEKLEQIVA